MNETRPKVVDKKYLLPFIVVTSLFALWGFANDITNPLVAAFKTIMEISNSKAALVQFAFYGGYATMAIPAALFVRRHGYKNGILMGLALYAVGALLFWPAAHYQEFVFFLFSLYILTFGLAFLETTANPFILALGDPKTATRRLNLAQSFNPVGSLLGMFTASTYILATLGSDKRDSEGNILFNSLDEAQKAIIRAQDLAIIRNPYIILGFVVIVVFLVVLFTKMPKMGKEKDGSFSLTVKRLLANKEYREGVIAQMFYVGAQIMCWTFIIQYAGNLNITKSKAQMYNILAMVLFLSSRFICTFLMRYISAKRLLYYFSIGAILASLGTIFLQGMIGLYCLIAISAFMSLMFPSIYGIALERVGNDATIGAAGLILAIVGGALLPPLQGALIDLNQVGFLPAVNFSFCLPLLCFVIIMIFSKRTFAK